MPEVITDLDYRIVDTMGREYYASVAGEEASDGRWEGWLEFVPLDNDLSVLVTGTETWQPDRSSLAHWAGTPRACTCKEPSAGLARPSDQWRCSTG